MLDPSKLAPLDFLAGGGEMGALTRAHDWSDTPIGPPQFWPQGLRTAVRLILSTDHPMFIWWGPDLIQFYNDAYARTMGRERHPSALGQRGRECWAEIWPIIGPQIAQVMSGGATWHENQLLPITRNGRIDQIYWTYGYSPIDEGDGVGGVLVICRDVTDEYFAAIALKDREAELARVQQIVRIGGLEVDLRDGFRNRRSPEYLLVHGLAPDAANETHEDWVRRIHPEDRDAADRQFRDAVKGDVRDYTAQYRIVRPSDGETRWISVKAVIERDETGRAIRLVGAHTDITDQVLAEKAVRDSEQLFRSLAEAVPHHVWTARPDGKLNWSNPRVRQYAGMQISELKGKEWYAIVHPDDVADALAAWTGAVSSGSAYEIEFRLRRHDGEYRWFLSRAVPVREEHGKIIRWIGTNTDVHDQRKIAAELATLNATLAQRVLEKTRERDRIWHVSRDLLLVSDLTGSWRSINPAWINALGWSEAELLGKTSEWLEHPDDHAATRKEVTRLANGQPTLRFENRLRHKDGSYRWLSWTAVPDESQIYAVARDVTEEKLASARLKSTEEALRQSQKMEAVGQLTGGIAHDFNNLLTGIVGSLDLMRTRIAQGRIENVERYIDAAMTSANRAAALTHRLLAFARRQPLIPKSVDANQLIVSLEDLLRRTIGEMLDLEIVAAADLWCTLCDPNQLESALLNLAINARDAMPNGGRLTIATSNGHLGDLPVASTPLAPGDYICIDVRDTGAGMTEDVMARAFDPFFTTKPIGQGTGLGLSMIYGFARQSNGHVIIESRVGSGTSVKLYLPRHHGVAALDVPRSGAGESIHASGETILIVEDDAVVRGVAVEMLREQGYQILQAVDGPSGLRILRTSERIDLLLTDVGLPGMNGRQLADQARETRPDLKILFMTGYAENVAAAEGFLLDGMGMITKPFDVENLLRQIRSMVASAPVTDSAMDA